MHGFPFGYASGWYQIGWSAEWDPGDVKPMRYFGRELVAYRTTKGQLRVGGAFCLHMGAHVGYGGTVEQDCNLPGEGWRRQARRLVEEVLPRVRELLEAGAAA